MQDNVLKRLGGEIFEYTARALSPFFMKVMTGLTMLAISLIENSALCVSLMFVMLVLDGLISFVLIRSAGESAYKMRVIGQLKRDNKPTGMNASMGAYKPAKEYRGYKGFVIGLVVSVLPIVLILVGAIGNNSGARAALMLSCGWAYMPVFAVASAIKGPMPKDYEGIWIGNETLWWGLIVVAVFLAVATVAYVMGGNREKVRQYMLTRRTASVEEAVRKRSEGEDVK